VRLALDSSVTAAVRTDVLERQIAAVPITDGQIDIDFRPFELVTLRLELAD
jgi:hypothetical protein